MEQVAVKPWGNSQGIIIPKSVLKKLNISVSDKLHISTENDAIILKKAFEHKSFEQRLEEYDGEISVCEFDWGEPVGREMM